jgi:hypothetical protein
LSQAAADRCSKKRSAEQVARVVQPRGDSAEAQEPGHRCHGDSQAVVGAAADRGHREAGGDVSGWKRPLGRVRGEGFDPGQVREWPLPGPHGAQRVAQQVHHADRRQHAHSGIAPTSERQADHQQHLDDG